MSLFRLGQHLQALGIPAAASTVSFPDIVDVRNIFLSLWYDQTDATHLLFVDSDMDFDSRLIVDMIHFNKPLVGAIYPARVLPLKFVGRAGTPQPTEKVTDGFLKVDGVGAGILLIRRDCITDMICANSAISSDKGLGQHTAHNLFEQMNLKRIIRAFDQVIVNDVKMAEDLSFCHRWRSLCGGEVWANVVYPIGHTGPYRFEGRYIDLFKQEKEITTDA